MFLLASIYWRINLFFLPETIKLFCVATDFFFFAVFELLCGESEPCVVSADDPVDIFISCVRTWIVNDSFLLCLEIFLILLECDECECLRAGSCLPQDDDDFESSAI